MTSRGRASIARVGAAVAVIGLLALAIHRARLSPKTDTARALVLEPSGCAVLRTDGSCERPRDGKLRVWIDEGAPATITLGDQAVDVSHVAIANGTRLGFTLPAQSTTKTLSIQAGGRKGTLTIHASSSPEWATKAGEAKARGDHRVVQELVTPHASDPDAGARARALGFLARSALAQSRIEEAVTHFRNAMKEDAAAGHLSDAVDDALALSFMFSRAARWAEARAELDRVEPLTKAYPDGRARLPYYRALASFAFGDVRASMRELDVANAQAARLGLVRLVWSIRNERALALERWGRRDDAIAELRSLLEERDESIAACDRASSSFNLGFATMVRAQETAGPCAKAAPNDAEAWLSVATALEARCPDANRSAMSHVLLGDLALHRGDVEQASAELAKVVLKEATLGLRRDRLDLEARIWLAKKEPARAREAFEHLVALAHGLGRVDDERRALEGVGSAFEALGKTKEALAAFGDADELLGAASVLVPLGEVGFYQAARDTATRARIELLVASGKPTEALDVARTARIRLLTNVASLDRIEALPPESRARWERAVERYRLERKKLDAEGAHDWEKAESELARARVERGEALKRLRAALDDALLEMPRAQASPSTLDGVDTTLFAFLTRHGALVFVAHAGTIHVTKVDDAGLTDAPSAARAIASSAAPRLGAGSSVRIVTSADLACLDLHAQTFPSGPRIVYGLDLPVSAAPKERKAHALVVSDTNDDLPFARDEGRLVAESTSKSSPTTHLAGRLASGSAFHDALQNATSFHYAGHAFEREGDIVLPLAGGARFGAVDALALPLSPDRVTLSACTAGRVTPSGVALGMGLVQALIERGTREVLAPTRPVRDELALALARALIAAPNGDPAWAIGRLRETNPNDDWMAYRVWRR